MVISYNQNLHFKIQCKKNPEQNYNSFHYIFDITKNSHNNMNMQITAEVYTFLFQSKYSKIPCFVERKSKQQDKNYGILKIEFVVF